MRVLITGATGFLGKYVIREFAGRGFEVIAFGRNARTGKDLQNCTFVQGDLKNAQAVSNAVKNADVVVHAGALSTVWGKWNEFESANVIGTENVVKACMEHGVKRLIFLSSPSIYTTNQDQFDIHEDDVMPDHALNNYIKSKRRAEKIISDAVQKGLYAVVLRPRGLFGVGDASIIPRLIQANAKIGIPLIGGGRNMVDITYVPNVAYAVYLCTVTEHINGETFNITNGEPVAFKTVLETLFQKMGLQPNYRRLSFPAAYRIAAVMEWVYRSFHLKGEPPITKYIVCTLGVSQTLNIDKAKEKLGYAPLYSIWEGIEDYATWWKENH